MILGRPSYFKGAPTASGAAADAVLAQGSDEVTVGARWTGDTHLLVTARHSVRVFHTEHLRLPVRTWNFPPDLGHTFTSAAVVVGRKRSSSSSRRSIVAIQYHRYAVSWEHSDEMLATQKRVELAAPVSQLLGGFFPDVAIAVGRDGGVTCLNSDLQEVGQLKFKVAAAHSMRQRNSNPRAPRPRRRSRSNSVGVQSGPDNRDDDDDSDREWAVHWAKHAPYRRTGDAISVLLFVLLRKPADAAAGDLLAVHELSRSSGSGTVTIKALAQHDLGVRVAAATIGVAKGSVGSRRRGGGGGGGSPTRSACLQVVATDPAADDPAAHFFRMLTFPNGPSGAPSVAASRHIQGHGEEEGAAKAAAPQPKRRRRTSSRSSSSSSSSSASTASSGDVYALAAVASRHSIVAHVDVSAGGIRCSGWDSGFCVPLASTLVPCRGLTADDDSSSSPSVDLRVSLELCPDGATLALVSKSVLAIFAIKCEEPTLASVIGCGQDLGTTAARHSIRAVVPRLDGSGRAFEEGTGYAKAAVWHPDSGSGNTAGQQEQEALQAALSATTARAFSTAVERHLASGSPLLTQNYVRACVGACHRHGAGAWGTLRSLVRTGRVSAWACPLLVQTILAKDEQTNTKTKAKGKGTKRKKGAAAAAAAAAADTAVERLLLVEDCLVRVQDLHEDGIVQLLRFVIRTVDAADPDSMRTFVRLMRRIVGLPYNGSFLRAFLRRLSLAETRLMLGFLRRLIQEEAARRGKEVGSPTMAQAVGWTTILLDAHFQAIVMGSRTDEGLRSTVTALAQEVRDLVETCRNAERIKAQVSHLRGGARVGLAAAIPSYSVEKLRAFA